MQYMSLSGVLRIETTKYACIMKQNVKWMAIALRRAGCTEVFFAGAVGTDGGMLLDALDYPKPQGCELTPNPPT